MTIVTAPRPDRGERWGTRLGVILAVAGSAVGLGNFLRFPGVAMGRALDRVRAPRREALARRRDRRGRARPVQGARPMTTVGWIFMLVSLALVWGLAAWCFYRVMLSGARTDMVD